VLLVEQKLPFARRVASGVLHADKGRGTAGSIRTDGPGGRARI